jgi:hypothetical protein
LEFQESTQELIFGEESAQFMDELDFKRAMNADERTFMEELKDLEIGQLLEMNNLMTQSAAEQQKWSAISSGVSGTLQAGMAAKKSGFFDGAAFQESYTPGNTYTPLSTAKENTSGQSLVNRGTSIGWKEPQALSEEKDDLSKFLDSKG